MENVFGNIFRCLALSHQQSKTDNDLNKFAVHNYYFTMVHSTQNKAFQLCHIVYFRKNNHFRLKHNIILISVKLDLLAECSYWMH